MRKSYALFLFDWDGTMMKTTEAIVESIRYAARHLGYPVPSVPLTRSAIGLGRADTMALLMPSCPTSDWEAFETTYREHYLALEAHIGLVPGMDDLLLRIKGIGGKIAIATGKSERGLQRVLRATGLIELVDGYRVGAFRHPKPAPEMILELCREFSAPVSRTVMVGDSTLDLEMAQNAGVDGIGVTWGACKRQTLEAKPHQAIASTMNELAIALGLA